MNGGVKKKVYAEESLKTRKAREKLKKQFDEVEKQITPQALEKKTLEIHQWIARHARHRVVLKLKTISLFDENQNAAGLSSRVSAIAKQLQEDSQIPESTHARQWHVDMNAKRVVLHDEDSSLE
jgi:hypothetical protein